jgi:hypothetical protein
MRRALLLCLLASACGAPESVMHRLGPPHSANDVLSVKAPETLEPWPGWAHGERWQRRVALNVNAAGVVTWAQALDSITESPDPWTNAAAKWRFEPGEPRRRTVTFLITQTGADRLGPPVVLSQYKGALTDHVTLLYDNVARLPRTNGRIGDEWCPLHHVVMPVAILPIQYSGIPPPPPSPQRRAYTRARTQSFPQAADYVPGPCQGALKSIEVYICPLCMKARAAWLAAHGGEEPVE